MFCELQAYLTDVGICEVVSGKERQYWSLDHSPGSRKLRPLEQQLLNWNLLSIMIHLKVLSKFHLIPI